MTFLQVETTAKALGLGLTPRPLRVVLEVRTRGCVVRLPADSHAPIELVAWAAQYAPNVLGFPTEDRPELSAMFDPVPRAWAPWLRHLRRAEVTVRSDGSAKLEAQADDGDAPAALAALRSELASAEHARPRQRPRPR